MIASTRKSTLPSRYAEPWCREFWQAVDTRIRPGITVLDIGAGRAPTISAQRRCPDMEYVGLDISARELELAPPGSYDEMVVSDAHSHVARLAGRMDLALAWQVLEHLQDVRHVSRVLYGYMKPQGTFIALLSGRSAAFAVANRCMPNAVGARSVAWLMRRPREAVFPAHYDSCDRDGLYDAFRNWADVQVVPLWRGATYFDRLTLMQRFYLRYENWAMSSGKTNLATHYVVVATKDA